MYIPAKSRDLWCAAAYSGVLRPPQLNPAIQSGSSVTGRHVGSVINYWEGGGSGATKWKNHGLETVCTSLLKIA